MDTTKIILRRYELQVAHDAGFHWADTRGVIGAKWGYSGLFGEYAFDPDAFRLVSPQSNRPFHVGVYGLRNTARLIEGDLAMNSCQEWALSWASDCLKAGRPPIVRRAQVRLNHFFGLRDESTRAKVQAELLARFSNLGDAPPGYSVVNSGVSMNASMPTAGGGLSTVTLSAGIMTRAQMNEFFSVTSDDDLPFAFGMVTTHEEVAEIDRADAEGRLARLVARARDEAQDLKAKIMIPVLANA